MSSKSVLIWNSSQEIMKILVLVSLLALDVHSLNSDECGVSRVHNFGNRIVGGREALEGEFPWMVSLQYKIPGEHTFHHFCGATILNKHWILTAAHCIQDFTYDQDLIQVVVGAHHIPSHDPLQSEGLAHYSVEKLVFPEKDSFNIKKNDIALIKIKGEMHFKTSNGRVNSICLPKPSKKLENSLVIVTGWGHISHSESSVLLAVELQVFSKKTCNSTEFGINVFCAGGFPGHDSCQGDSGGPAIQLNNNNKVVIVGIVSAGPKNCGSKVPGIYTEVSKYIEWIQHIISH